MKTKDVQFADLLGKTLQRIDVNEAQDEIRFITNQGDIYLMNHHQDCCECVSVESIVGDLQDLIGAPIVRAEENSEDDHKASESGTWTFYKLATRKGYVDIRWYGSSSGYYSEGVSFDLLADKDAIDVPVREVREITGPGAV